MKTFMLKMPEELHKQLKIRAVKNGETLQDLINRVLEEYASRPDSKFKT